MDVEAGIGDFRNIQVLNFRAEAVARGDASLAGLLESAVSRLSPPEAG